MVIRRQRLGPQRLGPGSPSYTDLKLNMRMTGIWKMKEVELLKKLLIIIIIIIAPGFSDFYSSDIV